MTNEQLMRTAMTEVMQNQNVAYIDEAFSPDFVGHDTAGETFSLDDFKGGVQEMQDAFTEAHVEFGDQVSNGDKVVTRWIATGTHSGSFKGIPATGKRIRITGISIDRIENGKIAESWEVTDDLSVMMQVGIVPLPIPAFWAAGKRLFSRNNSGETELVAS